MVASSLDGAPKEEEVRRFGAQFLQRALGYIIGVIYRVYIGVYIYIWFYRDNGKENGNYYIIYREYIGFISSRCYRNVVR